MVGPAAPRRPSSSDSASSVDLSLADAAATARRFVEHGGQAAPPAAPGPAPVQDEAPQQLPERPSAREAENLPRPQNPVNQAVQPFNPAARGGASAAGARRAPLTPRQAAAAAAAAAQQQQDDEIRPVVDRPEVGHVDDVEEIPRNDMPGQGGRQAAPAGSSEDRAVLSIYHGVKKAFTASPLPLLKEAITNMSVRSTSEGIMYHLDAPIQASGAEAQNAVSGLVDGISIMSFAGRAMVPGRPAQARAGDISLVALTAAAVGASVATDTYTASTPAKIRTTGPQVIRTGIQTLVGMKNNVGEPTAQEQRQLALFTGVVAIPLTSLLVAAIGSEPFHSSTNSLVQGQSTAGVVGSFAGYGIGLGIYEATLYMAVMAYAAHNIGVDVPRKDGAGNPVLDSAGNPVVDRVKGTDGVKQLSIRFEGPPKDDQGNRTFKAFAKEFAKNMVDAGTVRFGGNAIFTGVGAAASTIGDDEFQNSAVGKFVVNAILSVTGGLLEGLGSLEDVPSGGFATARAGSAEEHIEMQRPNPQPPAPAPARNVAAQRSNPQPPARAPARNVAAQRPNPQPPAPDAPGAGGSAQADRRQLIDMNARLAEGNLGEDIDAFSGALFQTIKDVMGEQPPAIQPFDPNAPAAASSRQAPPPAVGSSSRRRASPGTDDVDAGA